jgi:ATP-dependent Clp protease, protease subunit
MAAPETPARKDYYIGFNLLIDRQSIQQLMVLVQNAALAQTTGLTICMTSLGGMMEQAYYAYEILRGITVPISTFAVGTVQSSGVLLFLAGEKRYAAPGATFLMHQTVLPIQNMNPNAQQLFDFSANIKTDDERSARIVSERCGKPIETVRPWFEGQTPRDTEFAKANGLVHEVKNLAIPAGAEFAQVQIKF